MHLSIWLLVSHTSKSISALCSLLSLWPLPFTRPGGGFLISLANFAHLDSHSCFHPPPQVINIRTGLTQHSSTQATALVDDILIGGADAHLDTVRLGSGFDFSKAQQIYYQPLNSGYFATKVKLAPEGVVGVCTAVGGSFFQRGKNFRVASLASERHKRCTSSTYILCVFAKLFYCRLQWI
jgi:hypothetical protein